MAGVILILTIIVGALVLALLSELIGAVGKILESIGTFFGLIVLEITGKGTKESKEKLKNFIILIRFILLSILLSLIYLFIWHFIIVIIINDEGVTILSKIVFAVIGFNLMTYYEHCIDNARIARFLNGENLRISYHFEINPLLRIILIPIAIPVFISTYICDWITYHIYGNETTNTNANITKPVSTSSNNNYTHTTHKKYNTDTNYDNDFEDEYYCEMCFKKITEEEYDNFDGMCEECFEAETFDHM